MDWSKLKAEYIAGGTSYRKLAEKYGVPFSNLKNVAIKEKWADLREQAKNVTETKLVEQIGKKNAKIDDKFFNLVDKLLDKAESVIDDMPEWSVYDLKEMAVALKYIKDCRGVKSDADIREQEARIEKLRKETEDEQKDTSVVVKFEGEIDKWSK